MKEYFEIEVKNDSGKVVKTYKVKRVKRSKLNDLIELQKDLLYSFIKSNASIGVLLSDEAVWNTMETVAAMLPIMGQEKPGLPLFEIEDDYEQLRSIFFSQCDVINGVIKVDPDDGFIPSKIADLHQLDYQGDWGKQLEKVQKEIVSKAEAEAEKTVVEEEETTEKES